MNWRELLDERKIQPHKATLSELDDLRAVVARDLKDAAIAQLSADRRFVTAYNAILQLGKMVLACAGYRVCGAAHHQTTIEALELAMGPSVAPLTAYFNLCRRKRNIADYDRTEVATETEADEILRQARQFEQLVEAWIRRHHPRLSKR